VLAAQAQAQLAAMNTRLNGLQGAFNRSARAGAGFGGVLNGMGLAAFGSRIQWAGRQLEYNFTLPILVAGAAAMKLALNNEAAFTRITKVYGDATHDATFYAKEVSSLKNNFEALSNAYGVNQAEVLNVAAGWAAAGASGIALAKSVDLTMQTMILGEMDATEATRALISIQAQYGFGVADLTKTIAVLNMVENQTGISLAGLVQGFERSAGIARSTGVDVRHLAAMLAALTPATGSAGQAGNALKTIFSRLISPTKETTQVLGLMGISIKDVSWKSATMTDRLITMAKKFEGLSDAQKGVVSSVAASRWQVNKFEVLMRDLINTNGYYQKALQATAHDTDVFNQMNKELTAVLTSNPRRLQIIWTMLQNAAADIITPMIPLILYLAQSLQNLITSFSSLPQPIQLGILGLLAFMAILGPLVRIFGATALLVAEVSNLFGFFVGPIVRVATALGGLIRMPVMLFLNSMGFMARGGVVAMYALTGGVTRAMGGLQVALLTGASIAGRIWASGMGLLATITGGGLATIGVLWRRGLMYVQTAILAATYAVGVVWRTGLVAIALMQNAWSAVMAVSWRTVMIRIGTIVAAGFTGIAGLFTRFLVVIRSFSGAAVAAATGPWGIAIATVIVLLVAFWDDLKKLWHAVVRGTVAAFNALPAGIKGALTAVVNIVYQAVMAVYRLFSYLNPWAHHSPSLVENVTTGMAAVEKAFNRAKNFGNVFKSAYNDMQRFGKVLASLQAKANASDYADMRKQIKAIDPGALASYDRLVRILPTLKNNLLSMKPALDAQVAVVSTWKDKLDAANDALDAQQKILDGLSKVTDNYQNQLQAAQAKLDGFANAPIKGMKAMSDAIFENEMQQKQLRLEMMQMEDAVGPLGDIQSRIQAINGQIEMLRGKQTELRNAGAGSEILGQYDQQIKALEDQQQAIQAQVAPLQNLNNQIDELGRKADELDLQNSLQFDPLKRQIDDVANSMQELPFDQIIAGITANKAEVDRLTTAYDQAKAAADKQQGIVDQYTAQRDAVQARYDAESKGLQKLQDQYDKYESRIRDIEQALKDAGSAADTLGRKKSGGSLTPGAENFKAGAGGNFGDPGGFAQIGREGGLADQSKMIDDFTKEMADKTKNMFGIFNFLDPIKKGWNTAWGWVKTNIGPAFSAFGTTVGNALGKMDLFKGAGTWLSTLKEIGSVVETVGKYIWKYIGPEVVSLGKEAWASLQKAFKDIQPELAKFRDLVGPIGELIGKTFNFTKPILLVVIALIAAIVKGLLRAFTGVIGPVIEGIGALIAGLVKVIRGLVEFITGVFSGDWGMAWKGIKDIFGGIWDAIWGILSNSVKAIWGLISGFVSGFIGFFTQLYDELVGHSIIPDLVNAIIAWIASLPGKVWNALTSLAGKFTDRAKSAMTAFKDAAVAGWRVVTDWLINRPAEAVGKIAAIVSAFGSKAKDAMQSLKDGFTSKWESAKDWLGGMAGRIKSAIGSVTSLLTGIGKSIMNSLLDGLKAAWESTKTFLSGLGQKIKDLKGPIEKDKVLLVPEGGAIMDGLGTGLRRNWGGVEGWLAGVSNQITDTMAASKRLDSMLATQTNGSIMNQNRAAGYNTNSSAGGSTYNFYGDLEFPNISDGGDAEEFLLNLEAMVRG
jgi:TP901 family phage tail tape measure protein